MGRVSRRAAEQHRDAIIETSSRLIRERGIDSVRISDVMSSVGMTTGGFYRHFRSKEDLSHMAVQSTQAAVHRLLVEIIENHPSYDGAIGFYTRFYLGPDHQADLASGCPYAALAGEVARRRPDEIKHAFAQGFAENIELLASAGGGPATPQQLERAILDFAQIMGVTILARATAGHPISNQILSAARATLTSSDQHD